MYGSRSGMKKWLLAIGGIFVAVVCLGTWGVAAMDYGDGVAAGTYVFERNGESSTLVLRPNHTFQQTRRVGSSEQHSEGTWRHSGEGGVSFSKEFLVVTGDEPEPDGTTFSEIHKRLGLFTSLRLRQYHVLWYGKAGTGDSVVGTYTGDEPDVITTLILDADHSFTQTIKHDAVTNSANGKWNQDADGTIRFSRQFLKTSGEPLSGDELASSIDPQGSSLQIEISLSEHIAEPVFYKRLGFL
jgi:hypothetical protein